MSLDGIELEGLGASVKPPLEEMKKAWDWLVEEAGQPGAAPELATVLRAWTTETLDGARMRALLTRAYAVLGPIEAQRQLHGIESGSSSLMRDLARFLGKELPS